MSSPVLQAVRQAFRMIVESGRFGRVLDKVNITSAGQGRLTAEMLVGEEHSNIVGALHGGLTATIVDQFSTLALTTAVVDVGSESAPPRLATVSVELNISFMNAVKTGQTILIEAKTLKTGKNLAFLHVDIFNKDTKQLVATGKHTKYILNKSVL